jgi:hypothetical protein
VLASWLTDEGAAIVDSEWRAKAQVLLAAQAAKRAADAEKRRVGDFAPLQLKLADPKALDKRLRAAGADAAAAAAAQPKADKCAWVEVWGGLAHLGV